MGQGHGHGRPLRDMTNQVIGRVRFLRHVGFDEKWGHALWEVACECGTVKVVRAHDFRTPRKGDPGTPNATSCGCKRRERAAEHWPGVTA